MSTIELTVVTYIFMVSFSYASIVSLCFAHLSYWFPFTTLSRFNPSCIVFHCFFLYTEFVLFRLSCRYKWPLAWNERKIYSHCKWRRLDRRGWNADYFTYTVDEYSSLSVFSPGPGPTFIASGIPCSMVILAQLHTLKIYNGPCLTDIVIRNISSIPFIRCRAEVSYDRILSSLTKCVGTTNWYLM